MNLYHFVLYLLIFLLSEKLYNQHRKGEYYSKRTKMKHKILVVISAKDKNLEYFSEN